MAAALPRVAQAPLLCHRPRAEMGAVLSARGVGCGTPRSPLGRWWSAEHSPGDAVRCRTVPAPATTGLLCGHAVMWSCGRLEGGGGEGGGEGSRRRSAVVEMVVQIGLLRCGGWCWWCLVAEPSWPSFVSPSQCVCVCVCLCTVHDRGLDSCLCVFVCERASLFLC